MAINYTETDTNPSVGGSWCGTGGGGAPARINRAATNGGSAGTGTPTVTIGGSGSNQMGIWLKLTIDSGTTWNNGTWTWRINVTTANMNITLNTVYICQMDSTDAAVATIGNSTPSTSFGTTGVKSGTISGSAISPSAGDYVLIVFSFNNGAMTDQSFNFTPNQNIDSPFTVPAAFIAKQPFVINQTIKRASYY